MSVEQKKHDPFESLRNKDFLLFTSARFFLTLGIQMQSVIVGWQIYEYTHDALSLGLIGLAEAIPFICVALFAGHVADIVNRKIIILLSTIVLVIGTIFLLYFTLNISSAIQNFGVIPIYAMVFLTGIARGFLGPAIFAFMSQLIPRNLFANASTWNSTAWHTAAIIGPALAGLVYGFSGIKSAYLLNIILLFIAIILILFIPNKPIPPKEKKETLVESLSGGIKFVFNNQIMIAAISLDLFAVLFGGAVAMLPIFADKILNAGPQGLGLLRSAPAFGAVIAAIIMAYIPLGKNAGRNLLLSVAGFGAATIFFALSENFYLSLFLLALTGAFDNVSVVVRHTILQLLTPENMRGRVSSVNSIFIGSSNEIGAFESGLAAKLLGLIPSVIFGGAMTILVVLATFKLAPKLKKLNLKEI